MRRRLTSDLRKMVEQLTPPASDSNRRMSSDLQPTGPASHPRSAASSQCSPTCCRSYVRRRQTFSRAMMGFPRLHSSACDLFSRNNRNLALATRATRSLSGRPTAARHPCPVVVIRTGGTQGGPTERPASACRPVVERCFGQYWMAMTEQSTSRARTPLSLAWRCARRGRLEFCREPYPRPEACDCGAREFTPVAPAHLSSQMLVGLDRERRRSPREGLA